MDLNINDLLISASKTSFDIYAKNFELSKNSFSEKNIHDFRVCIRRFLTVNSLIYKLSDNNNCIDLKNLLKYQLKLFNPLRDNQVQFLKTYELVYDFPILYKYLHYLLNQEELLIEPLQKTIKSFNLNEIKEYNSEIILSLSQKSGYKNFSKNDLINLARIRFDKVIKKHRLVDTHNLRTIHKVRLAFKKFRYAIEILRGIVGLTDEDLLLLKSLQTIMGKIQDNAVYFNNFSDFSMMQKLPENTAPKVKNRILHDRKLLVEQYFSNFGIIYEFQKKLIFE